MSALTFRPCRLLTDVRIRVCHIIFVDAHNLTKALFVGRKTNCSSLVWRNVQVVCVFGGTFVEEQSRNTDDDTTNA